MSWHQPGYGYPASRRYDPDATQPLPRQDCYPPVEVAGNRSSIPGVGDETDGIWMRTEEIGGAPTWLVLLLLIVMLVDAGALFAILWILR